ncbi:MAG: GIY-YIG nuclease family protein [Ectothiorhodospiraceae bacterium]|nr:GIY-YIG nuclease family protein [Ectothiorhodospiraceae bacterium]
MRNDRAERIEVGRRGSLDLRRGYYVYIGSAFGPGGVRARLSRHWHGGAVRRWHVDYLRAATIPVAAWCSYASIRLEHRWACALETAGRFVPIAGFGCSDCDCRTHLYFCARSPRRLDRLLPVAGCTIMACRLGRPGA